MTDKDREKMQKELTKENQVLRFANGMRGQFILSQALHIAIKTLNEVDTKVREYSNIEDMQLLQDVLYPMYPALSDATTQAKKILKAEKSKEATIV